jgi:CDP-diacylglycerol--serine O-phosphatidyltransferase
MVAATQWFVSFLREQGLPVIVPEGAIALGLAALGLAMVSAIPYRSFKEIDLRHSQRAVVLMVLVLAVIVQEPFVSLFAIGVVYVLSGPVEWAWRALTGRQLEKLPEALAAESQQESGA